ncbi:MAG TPA: matrixin family metalloprotease [Actinomycetota bacterium]|nr:matrixin family metalloprotease [Actinomycetota bacterium]
MSNGGTSAGENGDRMHEAPSQARIPGKTLSKGDEGDDVSALHSYLTRFGYFPSEDLRAGHSMFRGVVPFPPESDTSYDDQTEKAVRKFQEQHGLEVTGEVDDAMLDLMQKPRCGFPDQPTGQSGELAFFVAQGSRWPGNNISYRFENSTADLSVNDQRNAVRGAFQRWAAVTPLNFSESTSGGDMLISWQVGDHGDGSNNAFDGAGGVLAHCYYPPPGGGTRAGDCHFDDAETWTINTPPTGIDLPTVALHELGHGLGLAHSNEPSAVMYAYYGGPRRELTQDDIAGIQSIYGARFRWGSLGGAIFDPVVANNADGRMEVFVRGTDNALWHIWQTAASNGWSGWGRMGGVIQTPIAVGRNSDGRLEVFARGSDSALWHIWQTRASNGWSGWASMGGWIVDPVVAQNQDGRLEVFVRGRDNALWHIWQTRASNGWSGWASLGGGMGSKVAVAQNADGRLEIFVRGTDGALWHKWQTAPNNGWSNWASMGGRIQGAPIVGRNRSGRLEVFARGMDDALWHIWQTAPSNGWSGWASMGGLIADPAVISNADGRMEVFVRGRDNALWHIWQTAPDNGWSGWATLSGQIVGGPALGRNADGRLEAFVKGTDSALWHTWQSRPNNGWT